MLEPAQQIKKIDLDYSVVNHQWFKKNKNIFNFKKSTKLVREKYP